MLGRIAVTYMEWAGAADQKVIVPWTVLDNSESADGLRRADRLAPSGARRAPRSRAPSIAAVRLLDAAAWRHPRRSSTSRATGPTTGRPVTPARDEAVAKGITINGLPIMLNGSRAASDIADLDLYYRDCVIGGPGAFMVPVRERSQFLQAIKTKIILEVAGHPGRRAAGQARPAERRAAPRQLHGRRAQDAGNRWGN